MRLTNVNSLDDADNNAAVGNDIIVHLHNVCIPPYQFILHLDKAPPYTAAVTQEEIAVVGACAIFSEPCSIWFHYFSSLQNETEGTKIQDVKGTTERH